MDFSIEEWTAEHARWQELRQHINEENQAQWAYAAYFETFPRYFLVALEAEHIVGFLTFVVWEIGPHDRKHPVIIHQGKRLYEAKIIAFAVSSSHRRQGIGRTLQQQAIVRAKALGCFQLRSVSHAEYEANHHLKLSMGFAAIPMERDVPTLTFVMPL